MFTYYSVICPHSDYALLVHMYSDQWFKSQHLVSCKLYVFDSLKMTYKNNLSGNQTKICVLEFML